MGRTNLMDSNEFVPYDIAKLLYDKGIKCKSLACYTITKNLLPSVAYLDTDDFRSTSGLTDFYAAPTYQTALSELRKKGIAIMIDKDFATENGWHYFIVVNNDFENPIQQNSTGRSYETAEYDALIYALTKILDKSNEQDNK
jgi:hypothetical protein